MVTGLKHTFYLLVTLTFLVYIAFTCLFKGFDLKIRDIPAYHHHTDFTNQTADGVNCTHKLNFQGKPLRTILLAINFNSPFYDNIPILDKFYSPVFEKYVFCGPELDKSGEYGIIKIPQRKEEYGYYGFQCLVEAIRRHPGYTGYLYVNDDMIINWWNFLSLDKTKIWFGAPKFSFIAGHVMGSKPSFWWKRADCGNRCSQTFSIMEKNIRFKKTSMFQIYFKNSENKRICIAGLSDIFYVPAKHAKQFEMIGQTFYDNLVFLEVSVPMSLVLLDEISNMLFIDGMYLQRKYGWGGWTKNTDRAWKEYNYDMYFLHPYKFIGESRSKNTGEFEVKVASKSEIILRTKCLDILRIKEASDRKNSVCLFYASVSLVIIVFVFLLYKLLYMLLFQSGRTRTFPVRS